MLLCCCFLSGRTRLIGNTKKRILYTPKPHDIFRAHTTSSALPTSLPLPRETEESLIILFYTDFTTALKIARIMPACCRPHLEWPRWSAAPCRSVSGWGCATWRPGSAEAMPPPRPAPRPVRRRHWRCARQSVAARGTPQPCTPVRCSLLAGPDSARSAPTFVFKRAFPSKKKEIGSSARKAFALHACCAL